MKKWVIANFKMYKTVEEADLYAKEFKKIVNTSSNRVAICPSFVCLKTMVDIFKGTDVIVGAQNCANNIEGAYTGEVSAKMIESTGAELVIVGHSERRRYYNETNEIINQKIKLAHDEDLIVVACLADDGGEDFETNMRNQLQVLLSGVEPTKRLILAFEPVWAIGTGKTMQTVEIETAVAVIKEEAKKILGYIPEVLYGGSVNSSNSQEILKLDNVDGLLVGGASKNPEEFSKICN